VSHIQHVCVVVFGSQQSLEHGNISGFLLDESKAHAFVDRGR